MDIIPSAESYALIFNVTVCEVVYCAPEFILKVTSCGGSVSATSNGSDITKTAGSLPISVAVNLLGDAGVVLRFSVTASMADPFVRGVLSGKSALPADADEVS